MEDIQVEPTVSMPTQEEVLEKLAVLTRESKAYDYAHRANRWYEQQKHEHTYMETWQWLVDRQVSFTWNHEQKKYVLNQPVYFCAAAAVRGGAGAYKQRDEG